MKMLSKTLASLLVTGSLLALSQTALVVEDMSDGPAVRQLDLVPPVTKVAAEIHWLYWVTLIVCIVIFIDAFGVTSYSISKHRKSIGHKPATFYESTTIEIIWAIVPFLVVIGMVLSVTEAVVIMKGTINSNLTIEATDCRWK